MDDSFHFGGPRGLNCNNNNNRNKRHKEYHYNLPFTGKYANNIIRMIRKFITDEKKSLVVFVAGEPRGK